MIINGEPVSLIAFGRRLGELRARLPAGDGPWEGLSAIRKELKSLEYEAERLAIPGFPGTLRRADVMLELAAILAAEDGSSATEALEVAHVGLRLMAEAIGEGRGLDGIDGHERETVERWGHYFDLFRTETAPLDPIAEDEPSDEPPAMDTAELLRRLSARGPVTIAEATFDLFTEEGGDELPADPMLFSRLFGVTGSGGSSEVPKEAARTESKPDHVPAPAVEHHEASAVPILDHETREAFRADAEDLMERIGRVAQRLDRRDQTADDLNELGRCLHTLKGASGSVGLMGLARFVHDLEDINEAALDSGADAPPALVDRVHELLLKVEGTLVELDEAAGSTEPAAEESPPESDRGWRTHDHGNSPASSSGSPNLGDLTTGDVDETVRVPGARLGDMMDLVAELFVLNRPRAALADRLKDFASTARSCRNRLTASIDRLCDLGPGSSSGGAAEEFLGLIRHLSEQAEDLSVLAAAAGASAVPMADDVDASARLARQLWDLLHEIRVVPVRPLLQRLARVAKSAARIEGKAVEVVLVGEDACLDRLVQDKVFEPMLHAVRNAVGHGIEAAESRISAGKPPAGQVTVTAAREEESFVLTVADDGRGLDLSAIESKARRLGLLAPGEDASPERLRSIIFRPGFTTRSESDAISGRGVGMDVVAQEVARLQGTIALDSEPGRGTTLTIRLPARLSLEQAMVFRVDGQSFALPMSSVEAGESAEVRDNPRRSRPISVRASLGLPRASRSSESATIRLIVVGGEILDLIVDAVEGPRELVARPLHPLLAGHPVISGTSLAADGELVFLLDPAALGREEHPSDEIAPKPAPVLVVDDSISVRRSVVRHLHALGLETEEAVDGVDALKKIGERSYRLIVTDIDMPRMDGFQLLAELGKAATIARPPIIVSSSRSDAATRRRVLDLGAFGFVAKPAGMEQLADAIGPLFSRPAG